MPSKPSALTVSQLNRRAKQLLEGEFPAVWVTGEISNFARPSSGHWYFTLKDDGAQVRCAMFRGFNSRLRVAPESGQQVIVKAKLSLFEARGDYQLIVEGLKRAGEGALAQAFEALKNRLQAEGLFAIEDKKALPEMPMHIAVITSSTGAALHDILTVLARRFPLIRVTLLPTAVQGERAAPEMIAALNLANRLVREGKYPFDLILLGRGGGSLEDLWAFNDEALARAIYHSDLPVVSAVGHEVDFTIADFVADVRAPTPSAAAELISADQQEWLELLAGFQDHLKRLVLRRLNDQRQQLHWLSSRLRHPGSRLQEHYQRLDELELRLANAWRNLLRHKQHESAMLSRRLVHLSPITHVRQQRGSLMLLQKQLQQTIALVMERKKLRLENLAALLDSISPLSTLRRGYAIVTDSKGNVVRQSSQVNAGDTVNARLGEGELSATIN